MGGSDRKLLIQRNNLLGIRLTLKGYNPFDNWLEVISERFLPSSTSIATEFENLSLVKAFGLNNVNNYWGHPYNLKGIIEIIYGSNGQLIDEYTTSVQGCFTRNDDYYYDKYGCLPPDAGCI